MKRDVTRRKSRNQKWVRSETFKTDNAMSCAGVEVWQDSVHCASLHNAEALWSTDRPILVRFNPNNRKTLLFANRFKYFNCHSVWPRTVMFVVSKVLHYVHRSMLGLF